MIAANVNASSRYALLLALSFAAAYASLNS